tara:strand:- start:1352 stop:2434 length:1083 start_codon:yes stop_codon:yes gene_type:complete
MKTLQDIANNLLSHCGKQLKWKRPPKLFFQDDSDNANNVFGKTAYYDPGGHEITIFITGRHPKDILRSISHEAVHHMQNLTGELGKGKYHGPGYAQKDPHMRKMEKQAYLLGNIIFRDWEDALKQQFQGVNIMITERKLANMIRQVLGSTLNEQHAAHYMEEDAAATTPIDQDPDVLYPPDFEFDNWEPDEAPAEPQPWDQDEPQVWDMPGPDEMGLPPAAGGPLDHGPSPTTPTFEEDLMESILKEFEMVRENAVCESCGGKGGLHEGGCPHDKSMEEDELEEGGKALRTGNEEQFDGNEDRFATDRVHEDEGEDEDKEESVVETTGTNTPEKEQALYERRFGPRNERLFKKLLKEWTK